MSTKAVFKTISPLASQMNELIVDSIQDIKGKNIVLLDLTKLADAPTDYFIICEGDSTTQVRAIAENVRRRMKEEAGQVPYHMEGARFARWICLDYVSVVVHVFYKDVRSIYELEDLWGDAEFTTYENI